MTDRKRVLWLTPDKPANISVGRQRIADHLEENGFDVTLRGTTIQTLLRSIRERGKYDVIIGTTRAGALAGSLLQFAYRTPLVIDHVDPIRQFEETHPRWLATAVRLLENVSFRSSNHVLYVYTEERDRVSRYAPRTSRTDLGVEFERFAEPDVTIVEAAKDRLESIESETRIAVYVGGLEPIYHIRELINSIDYLEDWTLLVLGEGSLSGFVRDASAKRDEIVYLGTVPHEMIPGYLQLADVGVSLVDDAHTLKVLEYGAAGLPVVQIAGRSEERFGDQLTYCDDTPKSIAMAIERAYNDDGDDELRSYVSQFDWADIADDYDRALISVI